MDTTVDKSVCDFIPKTIQDSKVSENDVNETNACSLINLNHAYTTKNNENITTNVSSGTNPSTSFPQNFSVLTKCKKKIDKK